MNSIRELLSPTFKKVLLSYFFFFAVLVILDKEFYRPNSEMYFDIFIVLLVSYFISSLAVLGISRFAHLEMLILVGIPLVIMVFGHSANIGLTWIVLILAIPLYLFMSRKDMNQIIKLVLFFILSACLLLAFLDAFYCHGDPGFCGIVTITLVMPTLLLLDLIAVVIVLYKRYKEKRNGNDFMLNK